MKTRSQSGIALATTLIVLFLVVALVVGFSWMVMIDQNLGGVNGNQQLAFYGAEAGMEKLTSDLGNLFSQNSAPSGAQVDALATQDEVPLMNGVQFLNPDNSLGYQITFPADGSGNPLAQNHTILSGAYQGMNGLLTPYTLTVTSRTEPGNSEVRLQRSVQTVSIPVFQFGMFSQTDLSFFAGPNFNFGGRIHTNGNLFLASGSGLTIQDKVTAAGEVVRQTLSNNWPTSNGYTGEIDIPTTAGGCSPPAPGTCRALAATEGSVNGQIGSWTPNEPTWQNLSLGTYNGYIRNGLTGAKPLNLSITLAPGANPIDLIRRPVQNENTTNPSVLAQRYFSEASVMILLSDNVTDITSLPCINATAAPVNLATLNTNPLYTAGIPIATSGASSLTTYSKNDGYWTATGTPLIQGYIDIEVQTAYAVSPSPCGTWKDVTLEVLNLGIAGRNLYPGAATATWSGTPPLTALPGSEVSASTCADPNANAIIRLERVRDNPSTGSNNSGCGKFSYSMTTSSTTKLGPTDFWPNVLFDTREGNLRDYTPSGNLTQGGNTYPYSSMPTPGGVMDYIQLDVNNLAQYLTGAIGTNGTLAKDPNNSTNDFVVYFSDRRGNYTAAAVPGWPPASPSGHETGEYGYEDTINPSSQYGCPNNSLDQGEQFDVVENSANQQPGISSPENYGEQPSPLLPALLTGVTSGSTAALTSNPNCGSPFPIWPHMYIVRGQDARENVPLFFRRGLKIVNGGSINLGLCPDGVACGLTIVSENPVYVQGEFNAGTNGNFGTAHVATAVISDAVTLLSDAWNDINSFAFPYAPSSGRNATTTTYRFGVVAGKGISFQWPGYSSYQDFGTDGGVHNFLRFLENWGGQTLYYRGSIVSFFYNRQALGVYKDGFNNTVYDPPSRGYNFDTEFLTPSLLPPRTPQFRAVNTVGFTQTILPTQ
jgi:hypothetical protein